jgi:hypothetical protein
VCVCLHPLDYLHHHNGYTHTHTHTPGQVFECENMDTGQRVAVKVIKNTPAYFRQGLREIRMLNTLELHRKRGDEGKEGARVCV